MSTWGTKITSGKIMKKPSIKVTLKSRALTRRQEEQRSICLK